MRDNAIDTFRERLDKEYNWPALYTFKFIVPKHKENEVKQLFINHNTKDKLSSNGNYISVTVEVMAPSSDTVIDYYLEANKVDGIIAL